MIDIDALDAVVAPLVAAAGPGEQIDAAAAAVATTSVLAYDGEIEKLTVADTAALGVRVVRDGRMGLASAGSLDPDIAFEALAEARDNLTFAEPDPHVFIPESDGVPVVDQPGLWSEGIAAMTLDEKVAMAIELERRTRALDPRISGVRNAGYGDERRVSVLHTSTGLRSARRMTMSSLAVSAMAEEHGRTQTGYAQDAARDPLGFDVEAVATEAVERTTRMLGASQPASTTLTLVFEPQGAAALLGIIGSMLSGDRVVRRRTPFAERVGEQVADPRVHLTDDPTDPDSFGALTHDGEGLAARPTELVRAGVLQGFLHHSASASRAGTTSTASARRSVRGTPGAGWHALHLAPGEGDLASIIAATDHGLLVHSMSGLHSGVNPVSGDYSVGIEGLMIRNGVLAEPVREATAASTLMRLLTDIELIGADVEHRPGRVSTPSLSVAGVSLSGA